MTPSNVERLSELLKWHDTGKAPDVPHEMKHPDECGRVYFENGYCAMLSWDRARSLLAELEADKRRIAELETIARRAAVARSLLAKVCNRGNHQRDDHNREICGICTAEYVLAAALTPPESP